MIITVTEIGVGIWALVRHEQLDALPPARLEENFALATTDQKSVWDHMQAKVNILLAQTWRELHFTKLCEL